MYLSVVFPCMNEEEYILGLVLRLLQAIEAVKVTCPQLVGIKLSANRGHQIALTAGL
jgi:polyisoprenyl-phosphate glycosyltransferase